MMSINEQVKMMRMRQIDDEILLQTVKNSITEIEDAEMFLVTAEKDVAGKPAFSNELKRSVELKSRLSGHVHYKILQNDKTNLEKMLKINQVKIDYLIFELKLSMSDKDMVEAIQQVATAITKGFANL